MAQWGKNQDLLLSFCVLGKAERHIATFPYCFHLMFMLFHGIQQHNFSNQRVTMFPKHEINNMLQESLGMTSVSELDNVGCLSALLTHTQLFFTARAFGKLPTTFPRYLCTDILSVLPMGDTGGTMEGARGEKPFLWFLEMLLTVQQRHQQ